MFASPRWGLILVAALCLASAAVPARAGIFDDWEHRTQIRFPGYTQSDTLSNFPALLQLSTNASGFAYGEFLSPPYGDLRFADASQTIALDHEVERWDTNGTSWIWVRVPELRSNATVWAYWGKTDIEPASSTTNGATWAAEFELVQHMADGASSTVADATANRRTANVLNDMYTWTPDGLAGPALQFTNTQNGIDLGTSNTVALADAYTIGVWFKNLRDATSIPSLTTDGPGGDSAVVVNSDHHLGCWSGTTAGFVDSGATLNPAADTWHYLVAVGGGGETRFYWNGAYLGTAAFASTTDVRWVATYLPPGWAQWSEFIDEFRIENTARSSNWVWACYANQSAPDAFTELLGPPALDNSGGATGVTSTAAWLNGTLLDAGADGLDVRLFWGETDAGTNRAWANTNVMTAPAEGPLSVLLDGLASNTVYHYTYYATNGSGEAWAAPSAQFKTRGRPDVDNGGGASAIGFRTATLNGNLTAGVSAQVWIYLGSEDGQWSVTNDLHERTEGPFDVNAAGLLPGSDYVYRCHVSNEYGEAWSELAEFSTPSLGAYYVTPTGGGVMDGSSWEHAFQTLQAAVDASATAGEVVYLKEGIYSNAAQIEVFNRDDIVIAGGYSGNGAPGGLGGESMITRDAESSIRLLFATNSTVVLTNLTFAGGYLPRADKGAGLRIEDCPEVTLVDCTIRDNAIGAPASYDRAYGGGIYTKSSRVTLSRCLLRGNAARAGNSYGYGYGGGIYIDSGTCTVVRCELTANTAQGSGDRGRGGALCLNAGALDMRNCLLAGNNAAGAGSRGDGVLVMNGTASVDQCTIVYNAGAGVEQMAGALSVTNTILWDNGDDVAGTVSLAYCDVQDGDNAGTNGCFSAYPRFERGLYLSDGSPCEDAGDGMAADLGLDTLTTRADGATDDGVVDLGYHWTAGIDPSFAELYVAPPPVGDDTTGDGSAEYPYATIGWALALAQNGTWIHIAAGTYSEANGESLPLVANKHGIRLLGAGADLTTLDGGGSAQVLRIEGSGDASVENVEIRNGRLASVSLGASIFGAGAWVANASVVFAGCRIADNTLNVQYGTAGQGAGIYSRASVLTLTNCAVINNAANSLNNNSTTCLGGGIFADAFCSIFDSEIAQNRTGSGSNGSDAGGGLYLTGGSHLLKNCLVRGNTSVDQGDGVHVAAGGDVRLLNVTVADNAGEGIRSAGTVTVADSILWNNGVDAIGPMTASYCDIQQTGAGVVTADCFAAPPRFERGFYLEPESPCVDAGSDIADTLGLGWRTTRIDGATDSGIVDLGYHYAAGIDAALSDLYVAPEGDDTTGDGSALTPYRTITRALGAAAAGTRVHVAAGNYTNGLEQFPLLLDKPGLQLLGTNAAMTVLDAGDTARVLTVTGNSGGRIEHVSIVNGRLSTTSLGPPIFGAGVYVTGSSITLSDCIVRDNRLAGNYGTTSRGGGIYAAASSLILERCIVRDNTAASGSNSSICQGGGVYSDSFCVLIDCEIGGNATTHGSHGNDGGGGVYMAGGGELRNCLIVQNTSIDGGDGVRVADGTATLLNNTIADNGGQGVWRSSGSVSVTNSILWNNGIDATGTLTVAWSDIGEAGAAVIQVSCFSSNPLFEAGHFLADGSSCLDAGTGTAAEWGLDEKTTRLSGDADTGTVDLGYHFPLSGTGANDLYVSANHGSDVTGDGSISNAVRSITRAIELAGLATRIHIETGLYTNGLEHFPLTIGTPAIRLLGTNAAATVVDAQGSGQRVLTIVAASDVHIENLTLAHGTAPSNFRGGGVYLYNGGATFLGCTIASNSVLVNTDYSTGYGGGVFASVSSLSMQDCVVAGNQARETGLGWTRQRGLGGGICILGGASLLTGCTVSSNFVSSSREYIAAGGGIYVAGGTHEIRNALIVTNESRFVSEGGGAGTDSLGAGVYVESGVLHMGNVTVVDNNGQGVRAGENATVHTVNSILWGNRGDAIGLTSLTWSDFSFGDALSMHHNLDTDPRFVDAASGDYHLKSTQGSWHGGLWLSDGTDSPCIDAGDPTDPRWRQEAYPQGMRINMGAYGGTPQASKSKDLAGLMLLVW